MMKWVRNALGLAAALALMGLMGSGAFLLSQTTPDLNPAWFYGGAGILYTMIVLLWLNR
ncbi:hypothetical protein [Hansschlegelia plantiphila]|uniref:Uncharacterized protein n=1 Tax=Hansschlegelia plantiphila TaxID=374655 RepID=A0A9W6J208_9HYPH|nr:hypothetical protein [Hansschlegelia plantiphila]GLK68331.1 hypothetical protein GCM10008179_19690 [Hansschlegelia plantiphila]